MTGRKIKLKPIRKGRTGAGKFARRVCEINDRLKAEGRTFADFMEIIRADRNSRVWTRIRP